MKNRLATLIAIICSVVIVGSALAVCGYIWLRFGGFTVQASEIKEEKAAAYIKYMETFVVIGEDQTVLSTLAERPEDLPKIEGVSVSTMVKGQKLATPDKEALSYVWKLMEYAERYSITGIWEYYISGTLEASIYANNVKIDFGKDSQTEAKFDDLSNFYDRVTDLSGTLNMTTLSELNLGYTFRPQADSMDSLIQELAR